MDPRHGWSTLALRSEVKRSGHARPAVNPRFPRMSQLRTDPILAALATARSLTGEYQQDHRRIGLGPLVLPHHHDTVQIDTAMH